MDRGSINGIPVWVRTAEWSGGERTIVKEAVNVDGASVKAQGQKPMRYRLDFTLIRDGEWIADDYETASLALRAMFLAGGPFTIQAPVLGEITGLWLADDYSLTVYDESRELVSEGSVSFIDADPRLILSESAISSVMSAASRLSRSAAVDFARRQTDAGPYDGALAALRNAIAWMSRSQGRISAAYQPINNVTGAILTLNTQLETLLRTPENLASKMQGTALQLLSLVPSLAAQGNPDEGSAAVQDPTSDKATQVYRDVLEDGAAFNDGAPPLQADQVAPPSVEDLEEVDETNAAKQLALTMVTLSASVAITSTTFPTVNSVLSVADALEGAFVALFEIDDLDPQVFANARAMRQAVRQYLAETAASLPRLLVYTLAEQSDAFSIVPRLYPDGLAAFGDDALQRAVDSVVTINRLGPDMLDLQPGRQLRYLSPLT